MDSYLKGPAKTAKPQKNDKNLFLDLSGGHRAIANSLQNNPRLSEKNKRIILEFAAYLQSKGRCAHRIFKIKSNLNSVLTHFASKEFDLESCSITDLRNVVSGIESSDYAATTKSDFKLILKMVLHFVEVEKQRKIAEAKNEEFIEETIGYPGKARFFSTAIKRKDKKVPEKLITREELRGMVAACKNARDECLIMLLYESAVRCDELGELRLCNVVFDEYGVKLTVPTGKTGPRIVRLVESERFLRIWLSKHPQRTTQDAFLWVMKDGSRLSYDAVRMIIKKKARKAGIQRRIHPHLFRHSRLTELARPISAGGGGLNEMQLRLFAGWTDDSDQPSTYVHLSGRDMDDALLRANGVKREEETKERKECPNCLRTNNPENDFCSKCGRPLSIVVVNELMQVQEDAQSLAGELLRNPQFMALVKQMGKK